MVDKRKHRRVRFGFWVHEKSGKRSWVTEDISVGGCFLRAVENLPVGSRIDLVFELPGFSHYIEATGEVKHLKEGGMGLEFLDLDNEKRHGVEGFVQDYS